MTLEGGEALIRALREGGVEFATGLPGTQNIVLFEALRQQGMRIVVPMHELSASFIANGYGRATGRPALLVTIPGPGFTYALTGIAEAKLDSVPLLHLIVHDHESHPCGLQKIPLIEVARELYKEVFIIDRADDLVKICAKALTKTREGEPGPVLLDISSQVFGKAPAREPESEQERGSQMAADAREEIFKRVRDAAMPLLFVGQGASDAAEHVRELAVALSCPVLSTISGRGVLADDHPLCFSYDLSLADSGPVQALIDMSDCVLALGTRLSFNATGGFSLSIPSSKLIQVDSAEQIIGMSYPSHSSLVGRCEDFLPFLRQKLADESTQVQARWNQQELSSVKRMMRDARNALSSQVPTLGALSASSFFEAFNAELSLDTIVCVDSGLHQSLFRSFLCVRKPRSFIVPSDFQSMGYSLPAAIGAALANPAARVLAVLGDGGFLMQAQDLLTLKREALKIVVMVFTDGHYGLIRKQQLRQFGESVGCELPRLDLAAYAATYGFAFRRIEQADRQSFSGLWETEMPLLIEVPVRQTLEIERRMIQRARRKEKLRQIVGPRAISAIRATLKKLRSQNK